MRRARQFASGCVNFGCALSTATTYVGCLGGAHGAGAIRSAPLLQLQWQTIPFQALSRCEDSLILAVRKSLLKALRLRMLPVLERADPVLIDLQQGGLML